MTLDLDHPLTVAAPASAGAPVLAPDPAHRLRRTRRGDG